MTETVERFTARSHWPVIAAVWVLFLLFGVLAMDPFVGFVVAEAKWLAAVWPAAGVMLPTIPAQVWTVLISTEIIGLGVILVVTHEAGHIIAHLLMGTSGERIQFRLDKLNPRVLVEGFETRTVKVLATVAPLVITLLPAALGLTLARGSAWQGLFALAGALAWGICVSGANVLINYLHIPHDARIRVSSGSEVTEWYIPNQRRGY
jgi:hypothetical protein